MFLKSLKFFTGLALFSTEVKTEDLKYMSQPNENIRGKATDRSQSQYEIAGEVSPIFRGPLVFDGHPHPPHNHHHYLLKAFTQKLFALGKGRASEDYI